MQKNKETLPLQGLLNGIGQVYFTSSVMTSFLLLLAISIESLSLAFLTLFGASCSYGFALLTNKPSHDIENGMYALNGALIALFIGNFFEVNGWLILVVTLGSLITVPIAKIVFSFKISRLHKCLYCHLLVYLHASIRLEPPFFHPLKHYATIDSVFNIQRLVEPTKHGHNVVKRHQPSQLHQQ